MVPSVSPVRGAVEAVLDGVRTYESAMASRLPSDWVAENGPCYRDFRADGAVWLHQAWEDYNRQLRATKDPTEIRNTLIALAAVAVKLAADSSLADRRARSTYAAQAVAAGTAASTLLGLDFPKIPFVDDAATPAAADGDD